MDLHELNDHSSPIKDFPGGSDSKLSAYNAGDPCSIPGLGRSPGEGNGTPLQYSCLGNRTDRGYWQAIAHGVAKSWTRLSNFTSDTVEWKLALRMVYFRHLRLSSGLDRVVSNSDKAKRDKIFYTLSLAKKQFLESQDSRDKTELSLRRVDIRLSLAILDCPKKLQG